MKSIRRKRQMILASAGVMLVLCLEPMQAFAQESVLPSAGVASMLEARLSTEEYLKAAQEAQGAAWGYTNIGIANVESGNLNVREAPSTEGKLVGKMPKNSACEILDM